MQSEGRGRWFIVFVGIKAMNLKNWEPFVHGLPSARRIYTFSSPKTRFGLANLESYIGAGFEVERVDANQLDEIDELSGAILLAHNTLQIPPALRRKTVVFPIRTVVNRLSLDSKLLHSWQTDPPLMWLTHSRSGAEDLRGLGLSPVRWSYRPASLPVPSSPRQLEGPPEVYWYWKEGNRWLEPFRASIIEIVSETAEIPFAFFPDSPTGSLPANARHAGKLAFPGGLSNALGMVRLSERLDVGRSSFDFLGHGRWVLYNDLKEDFLFEHARITEFPAKIRRLAEQNSYSILSARAAAAKPWISRDAVTRRISGFLFEAFLMAETAE